MRLQRLLQKLDPLPRTSIVTGYRGEGRTGLEEALGAKKVVPNRVRNLHISYRLLSSISPFNRASKIAIISSYDFSANLLPCSMSIAILEENLGTLVTELTNLAYEFSAWRVIA
jgi:hypothetical protein